MVSQPQEIEQEQCAEPETSETQPQPISAPEVESETCSEPVPEDKAAEGPDIEVIVVPTESAQNIVDAPNAIESEQCAEPVEAAVVSTETSSNVILQPQEIEQEQCAEPEPEATEAQPQPTPESEAELETCSEPAPEAEAIKVPNIKVIVVPTESAQNIVDTPNVIESEQCDEPDEATVVSTETSSNVILQPQEIEQEQCAEPEPEATEAQPQPTPMPEVEPEQTHQVDIIVAPTEAAENIVDSPNIIEAEQCTEPVETQANTFSEAASNVISSPQEIEQEESVEQADTTIFASEAAGDNSYYEVSTSLVDSDSFVGKLLNYGLDHIIQVANSNSTIHDLNFEIV